jgi:hypothetical protein
MKNAVHITLLVWLAGSVAQAQLLLEATAAFPAQTTSLEYDSLATLRKLPNYSSLRKQYSGEGLQRVQKDLLSMGISEDQLSEVVTAAGPHGFFGLLAGSFHLASVARESAKHGIAPNAMEDGMVYCSKDSTCVLLLQTEEGHAFFGTLEQLHAISDVRQGQAPALGTNAAFVDLQSRMDQKSPVRGFAPGREIGEWIGPSLPQAVSSRLDLPRLFSSIEDFGYSVKLDSKAHVGLNLICSSEQAGTVLRDALSAASGLARAAAMAAGSAALPFDKMAVSSSGRIVAVNLDAPFQ